MSESQRCDLCGELTTETQANLLACTYKNCEGGMYHQECLEKFLKSNRLEKNRKTGFKCPRGCGKGTKYPEPCPGRIDKSHPIYPRNEEKVKKRQQAVVEQPAKPTKADKAAEKAAKAAAAAAAAAAAKAKADGAKAKAEHDAANGEVGVGKAGKGVVLQPIGKAHKDKQQQQQQQQQQQLPLHEQLAQAKAAARKEMGLTPAQFPNMDSSSSRDKDASSSLSRATSKTLAPVSAWGKSGGSSAAASQDLDVAPPPPELPTLGQLPLLQQLMQQSDKRRSRHVPAASSAHHPPPAAPTHQPPHSQQPPHANGGPATPQLDSIQHFPPVTSSNPTAAPRFVPVSYASSASAAAASPTPQPPPPSPLTPPAAPAEPAAATSAAQPQQQHQQQQQQPLQHPHHPHLPPHSDLGTETSEQSELPSLPDGELLDCGDADTQAAALKLSKAQRKNLKRADKKKKKSTCLLDGVDQNTPSDTASIAESDLDTAPAGPRSSASGAAAGGAPAEGTQPLQGSGSSAASEEQGCIEALVGHKVLHVFQQLQRLGFQRWQAASALQCFGLQLQLSVEWLLLHLGDPPQQLAAAAAAAPLPVVDIASDLHHLQEAQSILRVPQDLLHRSVVKARGDVHAAIKSLAQAGTPPHHRTTNSAIRHSHQPSGESFHSAQSDMQSLPSQDLSSLEPFVAALTPSQHRLSLGQTPPPVNPLSSSWLPGLASANGGGSSAPPPGLGWEGSRENGGGSSRLSAWLRSDQRPSMDQTSTSSAVGTSSLAAWGAGSNSSRQQSLDGLASIGLQESGNPWGSSPLLGQYSSSQQDSAGSLLGLLR